MAKRNDQILVIDVESTCWQGQPPEGEQSEIIEIGLCPLDVQSLDRLEKKSFLVKPQLSRVSPFCTELTTITPEMLAEAPAFADACRSLRKDYSSRERLWASWGDYDRRQFERVCKVLKVGYPFGITHLNVKSLFAISKGLDREVSVEEACALLDCTFEGQAHRGHDDAWNIAGILADLLQKSR